MAPNITYEERKRIVALKMAGLRVCEIARLTGLTKKTVSKWIMRFKEGGEEALHDAPMSNTPRKRKTTPSEDKQIIAAHKANPSLSTRKTAVTHSVSPDTIRRRLKGEKSATKHKASKFRGASNVIKKGVQRKKSVDDTEIDPESSENDNSCNSDTTEDEDQNEDTQSQNKEINTGIKVKIARITRIIEDRVNGVR